MGTDFATGVASGVKEQLKALLTSSPACSLKGSFETKACVAILLRGASLVDLEVAFIRRATSATDRWSGQIAFPGGKREAEDIDDVATAIRETQEEVGIALERAEHIAAIDDIQARRRGELLPFFIHPVVFYIHREVIIQLNPQEAADFFWVRLDALLDPKLQTTYEWTEDLTATQMPAIQIHGDPPLWGLTYFIVLGLLSRLRPHEPPPQSEHGKQRKFP